MATNYLNNGDERYSETLTSVKARITQGPHVTNACIVLFFFPAIQSMFFPFPVGAQLELGTAA